MKTLAAVFVALLPALASAGSFKGAAPIEGTRYLHRGAQPLGHAETLRSRGIEEVVIFKNDVKGEVAREISELARAGVAHRHIPMAWKQIDLQVACTQSIEALRILVSAERNGKKTFVHCTAGEDRTGLISGLARMMLTGASADTVFAEELCANGYANGNPGKPRHVVRDIEAGLTPLFFALAKKIESGELAEATISDRACDEITSEAVTSRACPR